MKEIYEEGENKRKQCETRLKCHHTEQAVKERQCRDEAESKREKI